MGLLGRFVDWLVGPSPQKEEKTKREQEEVSQEAKRETKREAKDRGPLHIFGRDATVDPAVGEKLERGIYRDDRMHVATFGFPGTGKTRFVLSLIKQNIERDEGFLVIDPHDDLAPLVLSHIPPEKWNKVIYINPWTAFEPNFKNKVVQVNFIESKDPRERDVIARLFMDSLQKIYTRWWGPRLDMILMNALYLLMDQESPTLPDLYTVIADDNFRDMLLARCKDDRVKLFWGTEYKKMPKDAHVAVLTKIYRVIQDRIIIPMFSSAESSIDFRKILDQGNFVIVSLPEGRLTSDIANLVGCLILARLYIAGMSRVNVSEEERKRFYVYIDEAPRFTTSSIQDILQSMRKFKIFMTLASQYLEQYRKDVREAIPQLCETIACFAVGKDTAKTLEEFYPKDFTYQTLMNLPKHHFFASSPFCGVRESQILEVIDYGRGAYDPDEVINASLKHYGRYVNVKEITKMRREKAKSPPLFCLKASPAEYPILLKLKAAGNIEDKKLSAELTEHFKPLWVSRATANLSQKGWIKSRIVTEKYWRTKTFPYGKTTTASAREVRREMLSLVLSDEVKRLLDPRIATKSAGGNIHLQGVAKLRDAFQRNLWFVWLATGELGESLPDLTVTLNMPAPGEDGMRGYIDPQNWDYAKTFACEVEVYPEDHYERVKKNFDRNRKLRMPTLFAVFSEGQKKGLEKKLREEWGANVVEDFARFIEQLGTGHPETAAVIVLGAEGEREEVEEAEEGKKEHPLRLGGKGATALRAFLEDFNVKNYKFLIRKVRGENSLIARTVREGQPVEFDFGSYDDVQHIVEEKGIKVFDEEAEKRRAHILAHKDWTFSTKDFHGEPWLYATKYVAGIVCEEKMCPHDDLTKKIMKEEKISIGEAPVPVKKEKPIKEKAEKPSKPAIEEKPSKRRAEEPSVPIKEKPTEGKISTPMKKKTVGEEKPEKTPSPAINEEKIIEEIKRENTPAIKCAELLEKLVSIGYSKSWLAKKLGRSRKWIANYLNILQLKNIIPQEILENLTERRARSMLRILELNPKDKHNVVNWVVQEYKRGGSIPSPKEIKGFIEKNTSG